MAGNDNLTSYAYIAGLFDGEGCVNIASVRSKLYLRLYIVNCIRECLEFVQSHFGGNIYVRNRPTRTQYSLVLHGYEAKRMLEALLPYLIVKHPQAELAIAFQGLVSKRGGNDVEVTLGNMDARKTIADVVKMLNHGGKVNVR